MDYSGSSIGHFQITELIGRGGMGEVYRGYDAKLQRQVAIKTLLKDKFSPLSKARFLREARFLSSLDHPHICRIYEFIEGDENDFLVLEYIEGDSLRKVLERDLSDHLKFKIAKQITSALAAAHEMQIVHRDLKPENIILTHDDSVKVLDFGVSQYLEKSLDLETPDTGAIKHTEPDIPQTDGTAVTMDDAKAATLLLPSKSRPTPASAGPESLGQFRTGPGHMIGTPGYMSPEQAQGQALSTASDEFSLGFILHELYTGASVYDPKIKITDYLAMLRKEDIPPAEGIDDDLIELIEQLKSVDPAKRPSAPETLRRLDWIQDKAKRKLKRRLIIAGFAFLLAIAFSLGYLSFRLSEEVQRANYEAQTASQVSQFLTDLFKASSPAEARGREITTREILDLGVRRIDTGLQDQPLTQARLLETIGVVYRNLGYYEQALPLLQKALRIREQHLSSDSKEIAYSHLALGKYYNEMYRREEASPHFQTVLTYLEHVNGRDHHSLIYPLAQLAFAYQQTGRKEKTDQLIQRAEEICANVSDQEGGIDLSESLFVLANVIARLGDSKRGIEYHHRSLKIKKRFLPPNHPDLAISMNALATDYSLLGDFLKAEPMFEQCLAIQEKVFGPDHLHVGHTLANLAVLYVQQGKYDLAEPLFLRSLSIHEKKLGPDHQITGHVLGNLGTMYYSQARYEEAEGVLSRAVSILDKIKPVPTEIYNALTNLANVYSETDRLREAESVHLRSWNIIDKIFGPNHLARGINRNNLAEVYERMNRLDEAEKLYGQARDILQRVLGPEHYAIGENLRGTAVVFTKQGRLDKAKEV